MNRILQMYLKYYQMQEELFAIQNDKKQWDKYLGKNASYELMVNRVNILNKEVRNLADNIRFMEQDIAKFMEI